MKSVQECSANVLVPNPRLPEARDPETFTLRDVIERRMTLVFECANCRKVSQVDTLNLAMRCGPEALVQAVRFRARCTRCGKRRARPLLKDPTAPEVRAWWPRPPGR